jgi:hypothetical protein
MRRRALLSLAAGVAAAGLARPGRAADDRPATGPAGDLGWADFLALAAPMATALVADKSQSGQDAYLHAIAQHAARLAEIPAVELSDFGGLTPAYTYGVIEAPGAPFFVVSWRLEPGGVYPAHCHPSTNVCTLCTAGESLIRNFDAVPDAPSCLADSPDEFEVVETRAELLRRGVINFVTERRDNIHRFEAGPQGAEGIDITTSWGSSAAFSFLRLGEELPGRVGERRRRGRWVGRDIEQAL